MASVGDNPFHHREIGPLTQEQQGNVNAMIQTIENDLTELENRYTHEQGRAIQFNWRGKLTEYRTQLRILKEQLAEFDLSKYRQGQEIPTRILFADTRPLQRKISNIKESIKEYEETLGQLFIGSSRPNSPRNKRPTGSVSSRGSGLAGDYDEITSGRTRSRSNSPVHSQGAGGQNFQNSPPPSAARAAGRAAQERAGRNSKVKVQAFMNRFGSTNRKENKTNLKKLLRRLKNDLNKLKKI